MCHRDTQEKVLFTDGQKRPTIRAPDLGYAVRFLSVFLACADSRFEGESTLPPQAGNASR